MSYELSIVNAQTEWFAQGHDMFPRYVTFLWLVDSGMSPKQAGPIAGLNGKTSVKTWREHLAASDTAKKAYALLEKTKKVPNVAYRARVAREHVEANFGDPCLACYQARVNLEAALALGNEKEAQKWREILEEVG